MIKLIDKDEFVDVSSKEIAKCCNEGLKQGVDSDIVMAIGEMMAEIIAHIAVKLFHEDGDE